MDRDDSTPCAVERDDVRGAASDPTANALPAICPFSVSKLEELYEIECLTAQDIADRVSELGRRVFPSQVLRWLRASGVRVRSKSESRRLSIRLGRSKVPSNPGGSPANMVHHGSSPGRMRELNMLYASARMTGSSVRCLRPGCEAQMYVQQSRFNDGGGLYCSFRCGTMDRIRVSFIGRMPESFVEACARDGKPLGIAKREWFAQSADDIPVTASGKPCSKCRTLKLASEFHTDPHSRSTGLSSRCKLCKMDSDRQYRRRKKQAAA